MRNNTFSIAMLIFTLVFTKQVKALNLQGDLNFMVGVPVGEFSANVNNEGFGFGGMLGILLPHTPFLIGADMGFIVYGNETRTEPFSITIPDVNVNVTTSNNILLGHILLRLQLPTGIIRPYMDCVVGFNYLFTETKITNMPDVEEIAKSTNLECGTYSYGAGSGIQVQVYRNKNKSKIFFDFKIRYLFGGEAYYLKKGSITTKHGQVFYDLTKSRTDILTFQIGIVFGY